MTKYISDSVIEQTAEGIKGILQDFQADIEQTFLNEEFALSVSIIVKYLQEGDSIRIDTGMNLVNFKKGRAEMTKYISDSVIEQTAEGIKGILQDFQADIEQAFLNEEFALSVSIIVKYLQEGDSIRIDTGMNLVKERLKIKTTALVNDNQLKLFEAKK